MGSVKRQQTTDNGLQTSSLQCLDPVEKSVVGSQWSRIHKDTLRSALCRFSSALIGVGLRLITLSAKCKANLEKGGEATFHMLNRFDTMVRRRPVNVTERKGDF